MIAAYAGIQAWRKGKTNHMVIAITAFLVYAVFVAVGISTAKNPIASISTVVISIVAYLVVAVLSDLRGETEETLTATDAEVRRMDAQRKLQNSINRGSKSQALSNLSNGQNGQTGQAAEYFDPDKLAWMTDYLKRNEGQKISTVDIVGEPGCPFTSRQTANKYRAEAERRK